MSKLYCLTNDYDAYCHISLEALEDGYVRVKYDINGVDLYETNWENMGRMFQTLDGWEEELMYVINAMKGHNWRICIGRCKITWKDTFVECFGNDGPVIDLGRLAECYDDCETCDRCHNHDTVWEYDDDGDFEIVSVDCRDCDGCQEHPCIRVNGRKAIEDALNEWINSSERCEFCKEKSCEKTDFCKYD